MLQKRQLSDPNKDTQLGYSGNKKRHPLKTQLVVNQKTLAVIWTTFATGKEHDFHLFQPSIKLKK